MERNVLLIADDVEMNRAVIRRFFQKEYDVLEAADGKEVVEIMKNQQVDVLLLDIIMPEMNGLEVLQELKTSDQYDDTAILVATSTKEKTERVALQYGADDVVAKPYDPMVIHKRLENIVAKKKLEKLHRESGMEKKEEEIKAAYIDSVKAELEEAVKQIRDLSSAIRNNADNEKLIEEYADVMDRKCTRLEEILNQ